MERTVENVVAELNEFVTQDDEYADIDRLTEITDGLAELPGSSAALPALFGVLERHPNSDLGAPGPVVHCIESIGGHVPELSASIKRAPVDLTVWMVNRLLNSDLDADTRSSLLAALEVVARDESASQSVRDSARGFLGHQRNRR